MTKRISLFNRSIQLHVDRGAVAGRKLEICYGRGNWIGAGYIGGLTAYVALDCNTRPGNRSVRITRKRLQLGVTCNGNRVPYTSN